MAEKAETGPFSAEKVFIGRLVGVVAFSAVALFYGLVNCTFSIDFLVALITNITGPLDRREFMFSLARMTIDTIADCCRTVNKFILAHAAVALVCNTRIPGGVCDPACI